MSGTHGGYESSGPILKNQSTKTAFIHTPKLVQKYAKCDL